MNRTRRGERWFLLSVSLSGSFLLRYGKGPPPVPGVRVALRPEWKSDFRQRTSSYTRALPPVSFGDAVVLRVGSDFISRSGGFWENVNSLVSGFVPLLRIIVR
jgi:hypothetical protein